MSEHPNMSWIQLEQWITERMNSIKDSRVKNFNFPFSEGEYSALEDTLEYMNELAERNE